MMSTANYTPLNDLPPPHPARKRVVVLAIVSSIAAIACSLFGILQFTEDQKVDLSAWSSYLPSSFGVGSGLQIPCDPNEEPGFPDPQNWFWRTTNPRCPGEDLLSKFRNAEGLDLWEHMPEFRNKSVLFVGDSVNRFLHELLCSVPGMTSGAKQYPPGEYGVPYWEIIVCTHATLGFRTTMLHTYGLANASDPAAEAVLEKAYDGNDYLFEDRLEAHFNTTLKNYLPDYIQYNSGPWDYRYWFARDLIAGVQPLLIPEADLQEVATMVKIHLDYLQARFPSAKIWYQHMRFAGTGDLGARRRVEGDLKLDSTPRSEDKLPFMYDLRRQGPYRATMMRAVSEAGYDSLDYAKLQQLMTGQDFNYEKKGDITHPSMKAKSVMANMIFNKIVRHERYGL